MTATVKEYPFLNPPKAEGEMGRMGQYRVLGLIGEGGMGQVFLAEDLRLRRKVALKVMSLRIVTSQRSRMRFIREARAQAAVNHDNVATIYEVGQQNDMPFLAMELLKGQSLEGILKKGHRFKPQQILVLARQICHGLQAAHERGIVHRDIKPGNIWIEAGKGRPKILDFGLAALVGPIDKLSGKGAVIGTPGYLSPEQARDEPVDDRSDIYSLGSVMYEMCCGKVPFRSSSVTHVLIQIATHPPKSLKQRYSGIPTPFSDIVDKMLEKAPGDRPRSAGELADELRHIAHGLASFSVDAETDTFSFDDVTDEDTSQFQSSSAVMAASTANLALSGTVIPITGTPVPLSGTGIPTVGAQSLATPARRPKKKTASSNRPLVIAAASAAAALLIGGAAFFLWPDSEATPTRVPGYSGSVATASENSSKKTGNNQASKKQTAKNQAGKNQAGKNQAGKNQAGKNQGKAKQTPGADSNKVSGIEKLQLDAVKVEKSTLPTGGTAKLMLQIVNPGAVKASEDADEQAAVIVRALVSRVGVKINKKTPVLGRRRVPHNRLPQPGKPFQISLPMDTTGRTPGDYLVTVRLVTPDNKILTTAETPMTLTPDPNAGFRVQSIRTHDGKGADITIGRGSWKPGGAYKTIVVNKGEKKGGLAYIYLKFDLNELQYSRQSVVDASISLTARTMDREQHDLALYGLPVPDQDTPWHELGPNELSWDTAPSSDNLDDFQLLSSLSIDNTQGQLENKEADNVQFSSPKIARYLHQQAGGAVTFVVARTSSHAKPTAFNAKEMNAPSKSPALTIRVK